MGTRGHLPHDVVIALIMVFMSISHDASNRFCIFQKLTSHTMTNMGEDSKKF